MYGGDFLSVFIGVQGSIMVWLDLCVWLGQDYNLRIGSRVRTPSGGELAIYGKDTRIGSRFCSTDLGLPDRLKA